MKKIRVKKSKMMKILLLQCDFTNLSASIQNLFVAQCGKIKYLHSLIKKIYQIKVSLVKLSLSRNFFQKRVRVNFRNYHTVCCKQFFNKFRVISRNFFHFCSKCFCYMKQCFHEIFFYRFFFHLLTFLLKKLLKV